MKKLKQSVLYTCSNSHVRLFRLCTLFKCTCSILQPGNPYILWNIVIRSRNTLQNTLLGIDSKVIPSKICSKNYVTKERRYFTIKSFLPSSDISSRSHISLKKGQKIPTDVYKSNLSIKLEKPQHWLPSHFLEI